MNTTESSSIINELTHRLKAKMGSQKTEKKQHTRYPEFSFQNIFRNVNFEQEAKDDFGNLHPHWAEPMRKGYELVDDHVQIYTHDILNTVRQLDFLCIKTSNRSYENYDKCKRQTNEQIKKKIFIPIVNSSAFLYKVSNLCLLKGNSIDICAKIIAENTNFMFKLAAERAKPLTGPLQKLILQQIEPTIVKNQKLNNSMNEQ